MRVTTIDYETLAIQQRPLYPPVPVSVAIKRHGRKAKFYSWGHPSENTSTFEEAKAALQAAWNSGDDLCFFNAKFDLAVSEERMGLPMPAKERIQDPMILAFLSNPYENSFALKPLAEKHLNLPPTERDAVREWLVANGVCRANDKNWGAYISLAPGNLVGAYAIGDVDRTAQLFDKLYKEIEERGMLAAYDRERFLIPLLHENEKHGIRVDLQRLQDDVVTYEQAMIDVEAWLRKRLKTPDLNLDADQQLATALEGIVSDFALTATGKRSVAKGTLTHDKFNDQRVFLALGYRNRLQTALNTFMKPWLSTALRSNGRIYTSWRSTGAVTGRMSSTPNFQNIVTKWEGRPDGYTHPKFMRLPELPLLRKYILPDEGHLLVTADYAGQEVRMIAHFEDGALMQAFKDNPYLKPHDHTRDRIKELTGNEYNKNTCKGVLFGTLYGAGPNKLSSMLGITVEEARAIRNAIFTIYPGIKDVDDELKRRAREGKPFRTVGGREYYAEPSKLVDGQVRDFAYKCINTVTQGGSSDQTKAAMLLYDERRKHGTLLASVHDELLISVPEEFALDEARNLTEAMCDALPLDVPVVASAKIGPNFADMKEIGC